MLADVLGEGESFSKKTDSSLRKLIAQGLSSTRIVTPIKAPVPHDVGTYFRASSLGKACARKEALKIVESLSEHDTVDADLALIFAKGHAAHWMHQEHLMPAVAREAMVGWWQGKNGMLKTSPDEPLRLWSYSDAALVLEDASYMEAHVHDHENCIKGHPDMILDWDRVEHRPHGAPSGLEIIEFKTRNGMNTAWSAVDPEVGGSPLPEHVLQVQAYMMMTGIKRARIVYLRKGEFSDLQDCYAEHVVKADADTQAKIKKFLASWRAAISAAHSDKTVPERTRCVTFECQQSKNCALRYRCFGKKSKNEQVSPWQG